MYSIPNSSISNTLGMPDLHNGYNFFPCLFVCLCFALEGVSKLLVGESLLGDHYKFASHIRFNKTSLNFMSHKKLNTFCLAMLYVVVHLFKKCIFIHLLFLYRGLSL